MRTKLRPISGEQWERLSRGMPRVNLTAEEAAAVHASNARAASGIEFDDASGGVRVAAP